LEDQRLVIKRPKLGLHSLRARMILSFVAPVLLLAITIGAPVIYLVPQQLDQQAWAKVEQGHRAAQALYAAQQNEVRHLATLAAGRPTLHELLVKKETTVLATYLQTLQLEADLDLVLICDAQRRPVVQPGVSPADALCSINPPSGFALVQMDSHPQIWLFAAHTLQIMSSDGQTGFHGQVLAGLHLDDQFATQMQAQTGLDHTLLVDQQPVASSLDGPLSPREQVRTTQPLQLELGTCVTFNWNGAPYYAIQFPLDPSGLTAQVALAVDDLLDTRRRLMWTLASGILTATAISSCVGAYLARRIDRPLAHLTEAATALGKADLSMPITVETHVREVALVAQALERARGDWQRTLDQLRQEKAWADHLLEAIVEGIVTLNAHGQITFFSRGAERITGWSRDEVVGCAFDQVFRPIHPEEPASQLIPAPGRRQKVSVELPGGRHAVLAITGARLLPPQGGDARVALVFRDVSEEEAVHRLLGHFLANVAHEFRTPLSALAASVELLLDQAPHLSTAELQELLTSLYLGALGLQRLVDNLLESASIKAGQFRISPRPSNLGEIIAEAINMMQPLLNKHGQRLALALPANIPAIQADPRRTVQVLVNLISNASKYGPDEAEITIGAAVGANQVKVTVSDHGDGIPPEHRKNLFRRFTRLGDKAHYGAGLGLSVVKAIVEAQGGQVGLEDRPGGGSVFWFTCPEVSEE
jgi:PAS domain S-box-containing protein